MLAPDGVYVAGGEGAPELRPAPTQAEVEVEVEALVSRAARRIRRRTGRTEREDFPTVEAPLLKLIDAEPVEPPVKKLTAVSDGFNLHAATHFATDERGGADR